MHDRKSISDCRKLHFYFERKDYVENSGEKKDKVDERGRIQRANVYRGTRGM